MASQLEFEDFHAHWLKIDKVLRTQQDSLSSGNEHFVASDKAMAFLRDSLGTVVNGRWFISYSYGVPWFSKHRVLSENIIARIGDGGSFREVIEALKRLAKGHGCNTIAAGNFFSPDRDKVARLYAMHGFRHSANQLIMEV